jgi:hypothetical protein
MKLDHPMKCAAAALAALAAGILFASNSSPNG